MKDLGNALVAATAMRQSFLLPGVIGGLVMALGGCADPARVDVFEGELQLNVPGAPVNLPPAVIVRDSESRALPGLEVKFRVTQGSGTITGDTMMTDQNGVARVGSWVLSQGENRLTATVTRSRVEGNPVTILAAGGPSRFNMTLEYLSALSTEQRNAFERAAARWSDFIVGDVTDIPLQGIPAGVCGANSPAITNRRVDDVLIYVNVGPIDGPGQILGASGPCIIRLEGGLPIVGRMEFDAADLDSLATKGQLDATVLHEMGHVLGYGSLWENVRLLQNPSLPNSPGADTNFSGRRARAAFDIVGGDAYAAGAKVPVENRLGGAGTRDGHWRESVFQTELMTGFLNDSVVNRLSRVSVASLWDLGYQVNLSGAESYTLPAGGAGLAAEGTGGIDLGDDVLHQPILVIDPEGRTVEVRDAR